MGDKIENISNSVFATRGGYASGSVRSVNISDNRLNEALTNIGARYGSHVQTAFETIAANLEQHHDFEAGQIFTSFSLSAAKKETKKSLVRSLWDEFKSIAPHTPAIATAMKIVAYIIL